MPIRIDPDKCDGCGECLDSCPFGALKLVNGKAEATDECTLCEACVEVCPRGAILREEVPQVVPVERDHYKGIWVFAEQKKGKLKSVAYELVSQGRNLADVLGTELCAVCFGHKVEDAPDLIHYGADKIFLVDDPALADSPEDIYTAKLADLVRQHKPEILLAGATPLGRAFIPRVAAILETGLTADCTGLEIDPETKLLLQTRPTFGGNVMATIICRDRRPQMSTVRPKVFAKGSPDTKRQGQIIKVDFDKSAVTSKTKLLAFIEDLTEKVNLEDADIIVSGGRGLCAPENFKLIAELADVLGAALGSSRPPVDEGWISYSHQVGQTGKTVRPKLYVACGISGSVQHLAGMGTSEMIVAINEDPNAPIFSAATYGIVGDLFQVVPRLIDKLKESRA